MYNYFLSFNKLLCITIFYHLPFIYSICVFCSFFWSCLLSWQLFCSDGHESSLVAILCKPVALVADVDECSVGPACCKQLCSNTVGSYGCGCKVGFTLHTDGCECQGICIKLVCLHYWTFKMIRKYCYALVTINFLSWIVQENLISVEMYFLFQNMGSGYSMKYLFIWNPLWECSNLHLLVDIFCKASTRPVWSIHDMDMTGSVH